MKSDQVIIVRRKRRKKGRSHSSAWKIAFADFTLSMMAVFLVLWVISMTTSDQQEEIARYFNNPGYYEAGGSEGVLDLGGGQVVPSLVPQLGHVVESPLWQLFQDMEDSGLAALLDEFDANMGLDYIPGGVRINISESYDKPMFKRGGGHLEPYYEDLLMNLAPYLARTKRPVAIYGHSDAVRFSDSAHSDNWELSSKRANEARRTLVHAGLPSRQIVKLSARSTRDPLYPDDPTHPANRRIEIIVLSEEGMDSVDSSMLPTDNSPVESYQIDSASDRATVNQYPGRH
ncbi:MAG: flagellar motor protein MotB [Endozoicomonas sp.]